ncbi:TPA: hypothetical protein OT855_003678 [Serratia liquefaciens]|nr:hypothetical protein [Serratia liquefaciens]
MVADWELDDEAEKIGDERRWEDAQLAAKLVISGYERDSAVGAIKSVNENRESHRNDPGVHIDGDGEQPSEWTIEECNYPNEVKGEFNPQQVYTIAQKLIDDF